MIRSVAQVLPGGVHQFEGVADLVTGELAVALDDVAADDHRLNVGGTRSEDHDGDWVAEPVEVRGSHVDDRDIGLFAWGQGADLVLKVPYPGSVDGGQAQHVPLVQVHGRDLLAAGQGGRVGPGPFCGQGQTHLGEQVVTGAAYGVDAEAGGDSPAEGWPGGRKGAELHQHVGGGRDGHRAPGFGDEVELPIGEHVAVHVVDVGSEQAVALQGRDRVGGARHAHVHRDWQSQVPGERVVFGVALGAGETGPA